MTLLARRNDTSYVPSFIDRFFNNDLMDWGLSNFSSTNTSLPAVNVKETEDNYFIEVAAPGLKKNDFKINYHNNVLTISSERKDEKEDKNDNYSRKEFSYQSFQRAFTVPQNSVDGDKIEANYSDGILSIRLPKREELKPKAAKEIKIS